WRASTQNSFEDLLENLRLDLIQDGVLSHQHIVFITHGDGGLMVAGLLSRSPDLLSPIQLVYALSLPLDEDQLRANSLVSASTSETIGLLPRDALSFVNTILRTTAEDTASQDRFYCAFGVLPTSGIRTAPSAGILES